MHAWQQASFFLSFLPSFLLSGAAGIGGGPSGGAGGGGGVAGRAAGCARAGCGRACAASPWGAHSCLGARASPRAVNRGQWSAVRLRRRLGGGPWRRHGRRGAVDVRAVRAAGLDSGRPQPHAMRSPLGVHRHRFCTLCECVIILAPALPGRGHHAARRAGGGRERRKQGGAGRAV
jgi:hypothetical protein